MALFQPLWLENALLNIKSTGIDGKPCNVLLLCTVKKFKQEAFINLVMNKLKSGQYVVNTSFKKDRILNKPIAKGSNFWHRSFALNDLEDIKLMYKGKSISPKTFLNKAFGAKAIIEGVHQSRFTGSDTDYYSAIDSINILQTLDEWVTTDNFKIFRNKIFSFGYPPGWRVMASSKNSVTLGKERVPTGKLQHERYQISISASDSETMPTGDSTEYHQIFWKNYKFVFNEPIGANKLGVNYWLQMDKGPVIKMNIMYPFQPKPFFFNSTDGMMYSLLSTLQIKPVTLTRQF
ncbi:MAG: hypothetical protein GXO93_08985 [FCB group bacterium]|nr:hypothetical protein [FCB group bacterium]